MELLRNLGILLCGLVFLTSCSDTDGPRPVLASPTIKLIPEIETFSGNVGDTLEVNILVAGERVFQTIKVNKIYNNQLENLIQIGEQSVSIMPPYEETFIYLLEEAHKGQEIELEFRLDRREETPSGGTQFGFSSVKVVVKTHE